VNLVGAAELTGWLWLDPAVAVNLLREGWRLPSFSLGGLLDAAWPDEEFQRAKVTLRRLEPEGDTFPTSAHGVPAPAASPSSSCTCRASGAWSARMRPHARPSTLPWSAAPLSWSG